MEFLAELISGLITLFLIIFVLFVIYEILIFPFRKKEITKNKILFKKDLEFHDTLLKKKIDSKILSIPYDHIQDLNIFSNKDNKSSIQIYTFEKLILVKDENLESIDTIKNILISNCKFLKLGMYLPQNELKFSYTYDDGYNVDFYANYFAIDARARNERLMLRISYDEVILSSVFPERSKINSQTEISIVFKNITTTYIKEKYSRDWIEIDKLIKLQEGSLWKQKIPSWKQIKKSFPLKYQLEENIDGNFMINFYMRNLKINSGQGLRTVEDPEMPELFNRFNNFLEPLCANAKK